jgi:5'-phosphate synthase pdxT subunit
LGLLDIAVARNAFGRQVDSFEADLNVADIGTDPVPAVFIRAPIVVNKGKDVETLATYDGKTVFVRQGTILGSSFHPELTGDDRVHRYFLSMLE